MRVSSKFLIKEKVNMINKEEKVIKDKIAKERFTKESLMQKTKAELNVELAKTGNSLSKSKLNTMNKETMVQMLYDRETQSILDKKNAEIDAIVNEQDPWTCPACKSETTDFPALSREDNKTEICSACGTREAIEDFKNREKEEAEEKEAEEAMDAHMELEAKRELKKAESTDDLFEQPLVTEEEVKEGKKKSKKESTPKPDYRDIFAHIVVDLAELDNSTFVNRIPKKSYLKASTGNKNFTYAICLTKDAVRFEVFSKDCDNLKAWFDKLSPRNKLIEYVGAREGFDRCKIQKLVPANNSYTYDFKLVANEFNKFQKLIQPQVNKLK